MNLKESQVRKHIHSWRPYSRAPSHRKRYGPGAQAVEDFGSWSRLRRICDTCGIIQAAEPLNAELDLLPRAYWHFGDFYWTESLV